MKIWKKSIFSIVIIIALITAWVFWNQKQKLLIEEENKIKMAYVVKTWDIKSEVKVTATAKLANEQNLSFWQEWKITKVNVKVWDEIKAGQILAELNMDDYQNAIQTSTLELENAKLSLNKLLNNDTSLSESQINSQINETQSSYYLEIEQKVNLEKQLSTSLEQKKDELEQMKRDYDLAQKNLEIAKAWLNVSSEIETEQTQDLLINRSQTINSILSSLKPILWDMKLLVEKTDKIFWVSPTFDEENDSYEHLLSAKKTSLKTQTIDYIKNSYEFINKYKTEFSKINWNLSDNEINTIIQNFYNDSEILIKLFDWSLDAIDMSIDSIDVLPVSKLDWFSSTLNASRSSVISIRSQLQSLSSSINSLLSWESQENKLQVSLEQKQLDYNISETALKKQKENISIKTKELENFEKDNLNQINRKKSQIEIYSEKISVLKMQLKDLLDWPDSYDIKQQQNLINQAELRLERTRDQKDNYQIIAEFDGRIRTIDIAEWEQYKLDDRKYIVIENPNLIELELQVSQIDVVKIKEWDPVVVTFDAFPNNPITAKISTRNVNPETNTRGWIYYKANVILEKQQLEILAGMSALVTIITNQANNVILIPTLAMVQEWGKQYVYIKGWEEYKRHEIKTGIVNNFQAEVVEWLIEWNIIKASVLDAETLKSMWIEEWGDSIFGN